MVSFREHANEPVECSEMLFLLRSWRCYELLSYVRYECEAMRRRRDAIYKNIIQQGYNIVFVRRWSFVSDLPGKCDVTLFNSINWHVVYRPIFFLGVDLLSQKLRLDDIDNEKIIALCINRLGLFFSYRWYYNFNQIWSLASLASSLTTTMIRYMKYRVNVKTRSLSHDA